MSEEDIDQTRLNKTCRGIHKDTRQEVADRYRDEEARARLRREARESKDRSTRALQSYWA
jgi:hypothetical protein